VKNITYGTNVHTQKIKGTEYVYKDIPYWDRDKKQNRHRREYIGKLGADGAFIPNKDYLAAQDNKPKEQTVKRQPAKSYVGATYLLDEISKLTGIEQDLKASFPEKYKEILSLVYYLVLESDSPMYKFAKWSSDHEHPFGEKISSQRISEVMSYMSEESKIRFFRMQAKRMKEKEFLVYNIASVASWSEYIKAVRNGNNKDDDSLSQVNIAVVFSEESSLPVYYRVLPGSLADTSALNKLLNNVSFLEIDKIKLIMDRGFFSINNINELYKDQHKFLLSIKLSNEFMSEAIAEAKKVIKDFGNYDVKHDVYRYTVSSKWPYSQKDKNGKVILEEERRIFIHVYYNGQRAEEEKTRFVKSLFTVEAALTSGLELDEKQHDMSTKYFRIGKTQKRGIKVTKDEEAISKRMDDMGYFALLSNDVKDAGLALETYRRKDIVEKTFDNLKERLEMRRTGVYSDETLHGKFFLQFIALIYISYIQKHMRDNELFQYNSMQTMFDSIERTLKIAE
jgi:transposase